MPIENYIVLAIVVTGMASFAGVTLWLTTESGRARKAERHMIAAE